MPLEKKKNIWKVYNKNVNVLNDNNNDTNNDKQRIEFD